MKTNTLDQDVLLQIRASLGKWQKDLTYITVTDKQSPYQDAQHYHVSEVRGVNHLPINSYISTKEVIAKIRVLQQSGYRLTAPKYPELQEFFRDGKPITEGDLFQDSVLEIKSETDDRTGLEFLLDHWK